MCHCEFQDQTEKLTPLKTSPTRMNMQPLKNWLKKNKIEFEEGCKKSYYVKLVQYYVDKYPEVCGAQPMTGSFFVDQFRF